MPDWRITRMADYVLHPRWTGMVEIATARAHADTRATGTMTSSREMPPWLTRLAPLW